MNACFRCGDSIRSGETFCQACHQEVDLDFGRPKSWGWRAVVWGMRGFAVVVAAGLVSGLLLQFGTGGLPVLGLVALVAGGLSSLLFLPSWLSVLVGIYADVGYLHRYDAEWTPRGWLYKGAVAVMVPLFFLTPLLGLWYRYKRARAVDLSQEP